jgi:ribosomal protein S4E
MRLLYIQAMRKRSAPQPEAARKSVTLPVVIWEDIAEFRFANRIKSETEAIRIIIQDGLKVNGKPQRKP